MALGAAEDNVRAARPRQREGDDVPAAARRLHVGADHVELAAGPPGADAGRAAGAPQRRGRGPALGRAGSTSPSTTPARARRRSTRPRRPSSRSTRPRSRARCRRSTTSSSATSRTSTASGCRSSRPTARTRRRPAYLQLLARTYDALKAVDPDAPRLGRRARAARRRPARGHPPDVLADRVPPGARRRVPRERAHAAGDGRPRVPSVPGQLVAEPGLPAPALDDDRPRATTTSSSRCSARRSTGRPSSGSSLPILYDEFGIESVVPDGKKSLYTGTEPTTTRPVDERQQAAAYDLGLRLAFCQPTVAGILLFHSHDETALLSWQSGVYYADGNAEGELLGRARLARSRARRVDRALRRARARRRLTNLRFPGPREFLSRQARHALPLHATTARGSSSRRGRRPAPSQRACAATAATAGRSSRR